MGKRVLLVDDQPLVRKGIRALLHNSRPDWEICGEAGNGKEALEAFLALKPDLIILDLAMPLMDGFRVASIINSLHWNSRILVLTMHEAKGLSDAIRQAGGHGYVEKSHTDRDLLRAIDALESGETF